MNEKLDSLLSESAEKIASEGETGFVNKIL